MMEDTTRGLNGGLASVDNVLSRDPFEIFTTLEFHNFLWLSPFSEAQRTSRCFCLEITQITGIVFQAAVGVGGVVDYHRT